MIQENDVNAGGNKTEETAEVADAAKIAATEAEAQATTESADETVTEVESTLDASSDEESSETQNDNSHDNSSDSSSDNSSEDSEKAKVTIDFPYSEVLRAKVPKAFEVAEKVATDWKNEGDFTDVGITHPMAGIVASQALLKAKDVEKKLEEKGVFTMAKMGLEIAKSQVKSQVENIKSKIK
ncbi:hypothetical protein [Pseudobdellovibrio exovorus]|uniref:Uncharacterized protein n=1 Tax=Pseudobdellovibrio exovorus JSS TaxID=1184267 RepID=M4VCR9_9BACT|nr:hypothetical protein [Pseudobdellovibrio exovorus]AGH95836.1 hypothetical protein A11Q_1620 [Pseudobdellovibrio exovorus JSS]